MTTELAGAKGNMDFLKKKFLKGLSVGEKILAAHYEMEFVGYPDVTYIVEATQLPAMKREPVETRTGMGMAITQQGNPVMNGEITTTLVETLSGKALKFVRELVTEKKYVDIIIRITPESLGGDHAIECELSACFVGSDVVDLANESVTEYVKLPLTITHNWFEFS